MKIGLDEKYIATMFTLIRIVDRIDIFIFIRNKLFSSHYLLKSLLHYLLFFFSRSQAPT